MNEKTAGNLYDFLQYLAKAEIGPMLALPPQAVTFTLSEIEAALRELEQDGEVYRQSRKKAFVRLGVTFDLSEDDCALISTGSDAAHDFIRDKVARGDFELEGETYFPGGSVPCEGEFCPREDLNFEF